ncbi:MAG TPA: YraN family protein, partial [Nitriliruptorales bacterium]|nr:YraN family protein [Nitriliruptorales bacterium]
MSSRPVRRPPRELLGSRGEELAAAFLEARGYCIVARNWRPGTGELRGELDLVAVRGGVVAFVEVKTRRSEAFGGPFTAVTWSKQARIRA